MRQLRTGLASLILAGAAVPALAQQGSVQISASGQAVTGDASRIGTQPRVEPDLGLVWLQPGSGFGTFQLEVRGTRRGDLFHPGRTFAALRDFKRNGITWTLEGGDTYFSPALGEYKFSNLFTPQVTFTGAAIAARTTRTSLAVVAGRTTAWRNIFGTDPDALGQTVGVARATHRLNEHVELNARGSRIRTTDVKEFGFTIAKSDQGGGGIKLTLSPGVTFSADASVVSYQRAGHTDRERDVSAMMGASWLHSRGWVQVNASRFSPGEFPVVNYPLQDREAIFAAADYDLLPRVRLYAGGEAFKSNLDPARSATSSRPTTRGEGARAFGGLRIRIAERTTLTVRAEQGDRRARPVGLFGRETESDTGMWGAEWQMGFSRVNAFARYARRENVDRSGAALVNGNSNTSYTQDDSAAQIFVNLTRSTQLFGTAAVVRHTTAQTANTYVQLGGGAQVQFPNRDLWLRAEGTAARNVDLMTDSYIPRESLNVGINGRLSRLTTLALNVNVDRTPTLSGIGSPWMTRSTVRLVRTIPTGAAAMAPNGAAAIIAAHGAGTIVGTVFADWNANGIADPGENMLDGIPVRVIPTGATVTGSGGQFSFTNVPAGLRQVGLDTSALPVDFDAPVTADVQVEVSRGETRRVSFGLIPLGTVMGRVLRDVNGNGIVDPTDEPIDEGVVIMDDAARSEQVRRGRYRFDAVRGGEHTVKLLVESLPSGAAITGEAEVTVALTRERMIADVPFLVSVEKRPEIRRVFPPKGGGATAPAARDSGARDSGARRPAPRPSTPATKPAARATTPDPTRDSRRPSLERAVFAVQIAALVNRDRAEELVQQLKAAGVAAYVMKPLGDDPFYRVRVGPFTSRAAAERAVTALSVFRQEKLWVTKVAAR